MYHADRRGLTLLEKQMGDASPVRSKTRPGMPPFGSLGTMFSSVARQIFGQPLEAGKVMALAPFGQPTISVDKFFHYDGGVFEFHDIVPAMFEHKDKWPLRQAEYRDLSASVQAALECALSSLLSKCRQANQNLCYAGGVALNSVANHNVVRKAGFRNVYIIPAAEDSGTAIGAAYYGLMTLCGTPTPRRLRADSLGRRYSADEVDEAISRMPEIQIVETDDVITSCVDLLCAGAIVGWFHGGAEFGPRALGHRSILCDPRRADAKDVLNSRVKHRESFRPFAPAVLAEYAKEWFVLDEPTPLTDFMLEVYPFRTTLPGPDVPAVKHVDNSGRIQTVTEASSPRLYRLIRAFHERTGVPLIVNTSMNIMGEPITETPRDALWLLLFTGVDYCVIEDRVVGKAASFTSILDLVPHRTAKGDAMLDAVGDLQVSGTRPREIEGRHFVLSRVDGRSSFRSICDAYAHPDFADGERIALVGWLFRHGLVDFIGQPQTAGSLGVALPVA